MGSLLTDPQLLGEGGILDSSHLFPNLINSGILLASILLLRSFAIRTVQNWKVPSADSKRRWLVQIRTFFVLMLLLGLVVIWASELRTFAISLVAIAAAVVIATKELILCTLGGIYKFTTRPFSIGDRIQVGASRGDVIDHDFLSTTLFEIGPEHTVNQYTGRTIRVPNSVFLNTPIFNESFTKQYALHTFVIPLKAEDDWREAEKLIREAAEEECGPYMDHARKVMAHLRDTQGLDSPSVEVRVSLHLPTPERLDLYIRVPTPAQRKGRMEQAILRRFLEKRALRIRQQASEAVPVAGSVPGQGSAPAPVS